MYLRIPVQTFSSQIIEASINNLVNLFRFYQGTLHPAFLRVSTRRYIEKIHQLIYATPKVLPVSLRDIYGYETLKFHLRRGENNAGTRDADINWLVPVQHNRVSIAVDLFIHDAGHARQIFSLAKFFGVEKS